MIVKIRTGVNRQQIIKRDLNLLTGNAQKKRKQELEISESIVLKDFKLFKFCFIVSAQVAVASLLMWQMMFHWSRKSIYFDYLII